MSNRRQYVANAVSTDTFGRMICEVRDHLFVIDGPAQNKAPGVAVTPSELFLSGVATCAVELIQVIAKDAGQPLGAVSTRIRGTLGSGARPHQGVTVFDSVELDIRLEGVSKEVAHQLVEGFKGR